jgi:hypothetical protein
MSGFIKLYRGWQDSDLFHDDPYCERAAWLWIISSAAWKDTVRRGARGQVIPIKRGQLHTSLRGMATVFNWSKSRVDRFLNVLEIGTAIERKSGQSGCVLTVCNYDKYQSNETGQRDTSGTQSGTRAGHERDIQEEVKKGKKVRRKKDIGFSKPSDVSDLVWNDWVAMREAKKLSISQTVINGIVREADKAGWTLDAAIAEMVTRGWQGFKSEWVSEKENRNGQTKKSRDGFIEALDIALARDNGNSNQTGIKRIG